MATRIPAREARARFAEGTDRVRYTGEPAIIEKQGRPFVAVVRLEDLEDLERLRGWQRQVDFARHASAAADEDATPEPSEEEITEEIRAIRRERYRERYGGA
ncbi:MAG TPA: type II toxin-antitoxin system Phd/YefM family antitoxin [Steroidobacteraceae bacterium]|nr:type II toxin-antitoxin system Phd/YefM family antitoxin [Steroidobacteraceae bacterium]